jgi:MFS family permease
MSNSYPRPGASQPGELPKTRYENEGTVSLSLILIVGIFASTMPQPQALGRLPLSFLLKDQLHSTPTQLSSYWFLCGLFWYLKPIAGILTDSFPLFKTRRRHYMLISSVLAFFGWIGFGFVPHTYSSLLYAAILVNLFMVMMSTVTGAFLVEVGQSKGATGRLTSVRQLTYNACQLLTGPLGGLLATASFGLAAGVNAVVVITIFPIAYIFLREKPLAAKDLNAIHNAKVSLVTMGRSKAFWGTIVFVLLFYFAPGFGTLQLYRQTDLLHFSKPQIGLLGSVGAAGSIIAVFVYAALVRRVAIRKLLFTGIALNALGTLLYLIYNSLALAYPIDFQNGLFFGFAEVALIDLCARAAPAGCEGLAYSLLLSARNVALFGADLLGSWLHDTYKLGWSTMVFLNAGSTAIVLILMPFMPALLMSGKDGSRPNTENTGEPAAA